MTFNRILIAVTIMAIFIGSIVSMFMVSDSLADRCESVRDSILEDDVLKRYEEDVMNTRKHMYNIDCAKLTGIIE